jgi:hypothetical protein
MGPSPHSAAVDWLSVAEIHSALLLAGRHAEPPGREGNMVAFVYDTTVRR